jgi:hypothetical protein
MHRRIDMVGKRYGLFVVVAFNSVDRHGSARYLCKCDCGVEKVVYGKNLRNGCVSHCGCSHNNFKHGHRSNLPDGQKISTKTYRCWTGIKSRCYNPHRKSYENYGGRGITVCQRWLESFEAFLEDMGEPPTPEHSIDRIVNDGNYEPGNCRWATAIEQAKNKRSALARLKPLEMCV